MPDTQKRYNLIEPRYPARPWIEPKRSVQKHRTKRGPSDTPNKREQLWARNGGTERDGIKYIDCRYCKQEFRLKSMTLDHVIPRSKGGKNEMDNYVLACWPCNNAKGSNIWG
jgi:5-methylcytosine-specific restriction endonuclease McrA